VRSDSVRDSEEMSAWGNYGWIVGCFFSI